MTGRLTAQLICILDAPLALPTDGRTDIVNYRVTPLQKMRRQLCKETLHEKICQRLQEY